MELEYAPSLSLPKGLRCQVYSTIAELEKDANKTGRTLELANKYLREKVALVDGRDAFVAALIKATNFPMPMETVEKKAADGTVTKIQVPSLTEVKFLHSFRAACAAGKVQGWPTDQGQVDSKLQALADTLGPFKADATKAERVGKAKLPPQYALEAADTIIANSNQAKWVKTFSAEGVPFSDFQTGNKEADRLALAWAVKAREDSRAKKTYV